MGYEEDYDGTETIALTNPNYQVVITNCLSRETLTKAEGALSRTRVEFGEDGSPGRPAMAPSVSDYRDEMVLGSIISWNLTDRDGQVWPIDLEHVRKLKGGDFNRIYLRVDALNSPLKPAEAQRFPGKD